jgi:hypothetical protein
MGFNDLLRLVLLAQGWVQRIRSGCGGGMRLGGREPANQATAKLRAKQNESIVHRRQIPLSLSQQFQPIGFPEAGEYS